MAQPEVDVNDVLQSLGAQIANLTVQNASLQAQVVAYQKAAADESRKDAVSPLKVVEDDFND